MNDQDNVGKNNTGNHEREQRRAQRERQRKGLNRGDNEGENKGAQRRRRGKKQSSNPTTSPDVSHPVRLKVTPSSKAKSTQTQQDGNNLESDCNSETIDSAYDLESAKINQGIVYKGEKEEEELEGIEEEGGGDEGVEGER